MKLIDKETKTVWRELLITCLFVFMFSFYIISFAILLDKMTNEISPETPNEDIIILTSLFTISIPFVILIVGTSVVVLLGCILCELKLIRKGVK